MSINKITDKALRNQLIEYTFLEQRHEESIAVGNEFTRKTIREFGK